MKTLNRKKIIVLSVILIVAILASVFYFFAIHRMESSLQSMVTSQSKGKLRFEVKKIKLNIIELTFDLNESEIITVDSTNAESGYRIKAERISVDMHSLISMVSNKHFLIDSIIIVSPVIEIVKYKDLYKEKVSLPEEIQMIYQSLENALKVFNLNYLHIGNAKFTIDDRSNPATSPLTVSNLNLIINNFSDRNESGKDRFLFADRILLEIFNQDILFPDRLHGLKFKRLRLSTRSQTIKLDSCYIYGQPPDTLSGEFNVFLDSLRISNLDFNQLVKNNAVKVDSAICYNPDIYFKMFASGSDKKVDLLNDTVANRELVEQKIKDMLGNLDIGYLGVMNADVKVITEKDKKENIFESLGSNFVMGNFVVIKDGKVPIKLELFDLEIRNYLGYSPDSLYVVGFDGVRIKDKKIQLINLRINPTAKNRDPNKTVIKMQAFEIDDINWPVLFYEHRIVAGHATLIKPELSIVLPKADKNNTGEKEENPFKILAKVREKIGINNLYIESGNVKIKVQDGNALAVTNCFAGIDVNQLLASENVVRLIDAVDTFSFSTGSFRNPSIQLSLNKVRYSQLLNSLYIALIKENKTDKSSVTSITDARIHGIDIHSLNDIELSGLSWGQAELFLYLPKQAEGDGSVGKTNSDMKLTIYKLTGGATILRLQGEAIEVSTKVNQISTNEIILRPGQKLVINNLNIAGQSISLLQDQVEGSISLFNIQDQKESVIENVKLTIPLKDEKLSVFVPRLVFSSDINESLGGKLTASFIELRQPEISFSSLNNNPECKTKNSEGKLPQLDIGSLIIDQPHFNNFPASISEKMQINPGKSKIILSEVHSDSTHLKVDNVSVSVNQPVFQTGKFWLNRTGSEKIEVAASAINYQSATPQTKSSWSFNLDRANFENINLSKVQNDTIKQNVDLKSLTVKGLQFKDSFALKQEHIANFSIQNGNVKLTNDKINLDFYNLGFAVASKSIDIDSLKFSPVPDRDSFMKTKDFQSTYIQVYTGKINVKGLDNGQLLNDSVLRLSTIRVNDLQFLAYKDKRLPFLHTEKPMLTKLLLDVSQKIQIDSVIVRNGFIGYEEFNDKTEQYGTINFTKIRGVISNIKTFNAQQKDTLAANFYTRFLDTAEVRLSVNQSYYDSLSGGQFKVIISPFDLTALNPMLRTFASAELKSGKLDTLRLSVIGHKYVAYGVMKMYYEDLNLVYLNKGDEENKTWLSKLISFVANTAVKTKNKKGVHEVYAERDVEKRFVNYWVKIIISGVLTNTGIRSDRKQEKKYEKGLKKRDVPPIPDIPVDF